MPISQPTGTVWLIWPHFWSLGIWAVYSIFRCQNTALEHSPCSHQRMGKNSLISAKDIKWRLQIAWKGPFSSHLCRLRAIIMNWQKISDERMAGKLSKKEPKATKRYQRTRRIQRWSQKWTQNSRIYLYNEVKLSSRNDDSKYIVWQV